MVCLTVCCLLLLRFIKKLNRAFYEVNMQVYRIVARCLESLLSNKAITDSTLRSVDTAADEDETCSKSSDPGPKPLQKDACTQTNRETPASTGGMLICKLQTETRTVTVTCCKSDFEDCSSEEEECPSNCAAINDYVAFIDFDKLPHENIKAKWNLNADRTACFKVFKLKNKVKVSETEKQSIPELCKNSKSKGRKDSDHDVHERSESTNEILHPENGDFYFSRIKSKQFLETIVGSSETQKTIPKELQKDCMSVSSVKAAAEVFVDKLLESSTTKNLKNTDLEVLSDLVHKNTLFGSSAHESYKEMPTATPFPQIPSDSKDVKWNFSPDNAYFQTFQPKSKVKASETENKSTCEAYKKLDSNELGDSQLNIHENFPFSSKISSSENASFPTALCLEGYKTTFADSSETENLASWSVTATVEPFEDKMIKSSTKSNLNSDFETLASIQEETAFSFFDQESHKYVSSEAFVSEIPSENNEVIRNISTDTLTSVKNFKPNVKAPETETDSSTQTCTKTVYKGREDSYLEVHKCSEIASEILRPGNGNSYLTSVSSLELCKRGAFGISENESSISEHQFQKDSMFAFLVEAAEEIFGDKALGSSGNRKFKNTDLETLADNVIEEIVFDSSHPESHKNVQAAVPVHDITATSVKVNWDLNTDQAACFKVFKPKTKIEASETEHTSTSELYKMSEYEGRKDSYLEENECSSFVNEILLSENRSSSFSKVPVIELCKTVSVGSCETEKAISGKEVYHDFMLESSVKSAVEVLEHIALKFTANNSLKNRNSKALADVVKDVELESPVRKASENMVSESLEPQTRKSIEDTELESPKSTVQKALEDVSLESPKSSVHKVLKEGKLKSPFGKALEDMKSESLEPPSNEAIKDVECDSPKSAVHKTLEDMELKPPVHGPLEDVNLASPKALVCESFADVKFKSPEPSLRKAREHMKPSSLTSPVHEAHRHMEFEFPKYLVHKCFEGVGPKSPVQKALEDVEFEWPQSAVCKALEDVEMKYSVHKALDDVEIKFLKSPIHVTLEDLKRESPKALVHESPEIVEFKSPKTPVSSALEAIKLNSYDSLFHKALGDMEFESPKSLIHKVFEDIEHKSPVHEALEDMELESFKPVICKALHDMTSVSLESPTYDGGEDMELEYPTDDVNIAYEVPDNKISGYHTSPTHQDCNNAPKYPAPQLCKDRELEFEVSENIELKSATDKISIFETHGMNTQVFRNSSCKTSKEALFESPDHKDSKETIDYSGRDAGKDIDKHTGSLDVERDVESKQFSGSCSKLFPEISSDCPTTSEICSKEKLTDGRVEAKSVAIALRNIDLLTESMIDASKGRLKKVNESEHQIFPLSNARTSCELGTDFFTAAMEECQVLKLLSGDSTTAISKPDLENLNLLIGELNFLQNAYCNHTDKPCQQDDSTASNRLIKYVNSNLQTQMISCDFSTEEQFSETSNPSESNTHNSKDLFQINSSFQVTEVETPTNLVTSAELKDWRQNKNLKTYLKNEKEDKNLVSFDTQSSNLVFNEINEKNACLVLKLLNKETQAMADSDTNEFSQKCKNTPIFECDRSSFYKHISRVFDPTFGRLMHSQGKTYIISKPCDFQINNPRTLPRLSPPPSFYESERYFSRTRGNSKAKNKSSCNSNPIIVEISSGRNIKITDINILAETDHVAARDVAEAAALIIGDITERSTQSNKGDIADTAALNAGGVFETVAGTAKHVAKTDAVRTGDEAANTGNLGGDNNKPGLDCDETLHRSVQGAESDEFSKTQEDEKVAPKKKNKKSKKSKKTSKRFYRH